MKSGDKAERRSLTAKKDLLVHSYDSFLVSQTRLFTLAHYTYHFESSEIESKQRLLFLDDLLTFGITARRLIELTGLRSFSNSQRVPVLQFNVRERGLKESQVGFLTIINNIIHSRFIELITNNFATSNLRGNSEVEIIGYFNKFNEVDRVKGWREYSVDPAIIVRSDKTPMFGAKLRDVIGASSEVSEKIAEVCTESKIFLELEYRGA